MLDKGVAAYTPLAANAIDNMNTAPVCRVIICAQGQSNVRAYFWPWLSTARLPTRLRSKHSPYCHARHLKLHVSVNFPAAVAISCGQSVKRVDQQLTATRRRVCRYRKKSCASSVQRCKMASHEPRRCCCGRSTHERMNLSRIRSARSG